MEKGQLEKRASGGAVVEVRARKGCPNLGADEKTGHPGGGRGVKGAREKP